MYSPEYGSHIISSTFEKEIRVYYNFYGATGQHRIGSGNRAIELLVFGYRS
jgi:hypothetical protein